jgi:hypothetical protein
MSGAERIARFRAGITGKKRLKRRRKPKIIEIDDDSPPDPPSKSKWEQHHRAQLSHLADTMPADTWNHPDPRVRGLHYAAQESIKHAVGDDLAGMVDIPQGTRLAVQQAVTAWTELLQIVNAEEVTKPAVTKVEVEVANG